MYGLWGYMLKAKALAPINARRVLQRVDDTFKKKLNIVMSYGVNHIIFIRYIS